MSLRLAWCRPLVVVLGLLPLMHSIQLLGLEDSEACNRRLSCSSGLLGGGLGTALAGGVSNELAGLCALLGGSQSHDVTLKAMQVLQVHQAMAAQAEGSRSCLPSYDRRRGGEEDERPRRTPVASTIPGQAETKGRWRGPR